MNMNFTNLEIDENEIMNKFSTTLVEIPYFLLDEWDNEYQFVTILEALKKSLGTYYVSEKDALVPNLIRTKENVSGIWSMYLMDQEIGMDQGLV